LFWKRRWKLIRAEPCEMNLEFFIARRLITQKKSKGNKTEPAIRIAIIGIAVGLAVMLIAWAVIMGFRREVRNKVIGVNSHIQLTSYFSGMTYEMTPVRISDNLYSKLEAAPGVAHIQRFYTKPGMIKTENDFQAIVLKGMDPDFDSRFIRQSLIEGKMPDVRTQTNDIVISEYLSKRLHLKLGDTFATFFLREKSVSPRKFRVSGVYNTHFSEFDKYFIIGDARHVRKVNGWDEKQASGLEIFVRSMNDFPKTEEEIYGIVSTHSDQSGDAYYMRNLFEMNPELFGWLDLLDTNVWLILILMVFVSGFNIISGLLILILERTNMIGVMKALGARNYSLRKIFIYLSAFLIGKGLFWGNIIGLTFCILQKYFHLIPLNPDTYYVDAVPIEMNWIYIVVLNLGTVIISLLVVFLPTHLISRIRPVKAIRFD
jgi:lipoprotein-releasing system permease protein